MSRCSNAPFTEWGFAEVIRTIEELELAQSPTGSDLNQASSPVAGGAGENVPAGSSATAAVTQGQLAALQASVAAIQALMSAVVVAAYAPSTNLLSGVQAALTYSTTNISTVPSAWSGSVFTAPVRGYYLIQATIDAAIGNFGTALVNLTFGGSGFNGIATNAMQSNGNGDPLTSAASICLMDVGQTLSVLATQSGTGAIVPTGSVNIVRLPIA